MIEMGWTHDTLNGMSEAEFGWWYDEAITLEQAKADAIREAQAK